MDVRAQVSMVFHLDKCIGCHTCSVACKNVWTDRAGAEYMWWNNVETKPGTGYPSRWEDQNNYQGGWEVTDGRELKLKSQNKASAFFKMLFNPPQPTMKDYYEPWSYKYDDLFSSPLGDDQPTAVPISQITGEPIDIKSGPNWDDDLSGSPVHAENDVNLDELSEEERNALFEVERISMMYLPRICNHCANPSCVASCPSGALYKRGEDGIVLVNQDKCRGWRACVTACPYKKVYYNWKTGKSEKCILCYPRLETGQAPACFHSCVGRIRYLGVLLYDAERVTEAMKAPAQSLVEAQRSALLDPNDPEVQAAARANGVSEEFLHAAIHSPVYKYVMEWKLALPLHVEFRTMPMLFYVPPLLPVMGKNDASLYEPTGEGFFTALENARMPIKFLSKLFSAGNESVVEASLRKLMAVRYYMRSLEINDVDSVKIRQVMHEAGLTEEEAKAIHALTAIPTVDDRFVLPPIQRERAIEPTCSPEVCKGCTGFGEKEPPHRGA